MSDNWPGEKVESAWPGEKVSTSQEKPAERSLVGFGENVVKSGGQFVGDIASAVAHPIETAKNIGNVGLGYLSKLPFSNMPQEYGQYADAVNKFYAERYGGLENVKKTLYEDPVGAAADLATVLMGGEGALARVPGAAKAAEVAGKVGTAVNPLTLPTKAIGGLAKAAGGISEIPAQAIGSVVTHTGAEGVKGAMRSGVEGGAEGQAFRASLRDPEAQQVAIVDRFRKALDQVYQERSGAYQKGMQQIGKSNQVLDFKDIDSAVSQSRRIKQFKGTNVSELAGAKTQLPAEKVRDQIETAITGWKQLDPAQYHTPAGLDALKQYIGEIKDGLDYHTPERKVAEELYGAVRNTIVKQAPEYAGVMKGYSEASELIDELRRTLSLGKKASTDTTLRKLLSATRSNVNTNFGYRANLAKQLSKRDPTLMASISGQSLAPWFPQGLGKLQAGGLGLASYLAHQPHLAAALGAMSPRVWGEATHGIGRLLGQIPPSARKQLANIPVMVGGKINPEFLRRLALVARAGGETSRAAQ